MFRILMERMYGKILKAGLFTNTTSMSLREIDTFLGRPLLFPVDVWC